MLLSIRGLKTHFYTKNGIVKAVDGISLDVDRGEFVGLVGESGSGKSITALSILRLVPPPGRIVGGEVLLDGQDLLKKDEVEMRKIRGGRISMVFQDPMTFLNPVMSIGDQIAESIILHQNVPKSVAMSKVIETLELVKIEPRRVRDYPHQLSGGMRQRVMIAVALAAQPDLVILDEPTTALDVITQDKILQLLVEINTRLRTAMLLITHDLGIVAEVTDRVAVAYAGKIMETADTETIFSNPKHPYTEGLLKAIPRVDRRESRLYTIPGWVPDLINAPEACRFSARCPYVMEKCLSTDPRMLEIARGHNAACIRYESEVNG